MCAFLLIGMTLPLHLAGATELPEEDRRAARPLITQALASYGARDYARAERLLLAAFQVYPSEKIQFSLGAVYEAAGRKAEALAAYERYLAEVPAEQRTIDRTVEARLAVARLGANGGAVRIVKDLRDPFDVRGKETPSAQERADGAVVFARPASQRLRTAGWTLLGLGLASSAVGVTLWGLDGTQACGLRSEGALCPSYLAGRDPGAALLTLGAVGVATAGVVIYLARRATGPAEVRP